MSSLKYVALSLGCLVLASSLRAQTPSPDDLLRRIEELEKQVAGLQQRNTPLSLDELKRQIDVLAEEVTRLQQGEKPPPAGDVAAPVAEQATSATRVYRTPSGLSIGGYGELLYQNFSRRQQNGVPSERVDQVDLLRGVLYTGYRFSDRALFNSELEVAHGKVEGNRGEVSLEFAYLDFLLNPAFNIRAGKVLVPVGFINEMHEPTTFAGSRRPLVEQLIIPSTWGEPGAGVYGDAGPFSYRAYLVTGLDSAGFSSGEAIRGGRQDGSQASAEDFALTGRLDWHPFEGSLAGASLYGGHAGQNRQSPAGGRLRAAVTLAEVHAESKFRGLTLRALWAAGRLGDAAEVNILNGFTADQSVGSRFGGWYGEAGYDLGTLMRRGRSIAPFIRYEKLDTQRRVPAGFSRGPENNQNIATIGVVWKPVAQTAFKFDWQHVRNRARSGVNQFNLSLGYIF